MEINKPNGGNQTLKRNQPRDLKPKSCKGYLYFNSTLKSDSLNPRCLGLSRTLNQEAHYILRRPEVEASKEGQAPQDFNYSCIGYSVYLDTGNHLKDEQGKRIDLLTACTGLEVLAERRVSTSDPLSSPVRVHNRKDEKEIPHPHAQKPAYSMSDEFLSRFTRNSRLVAAGVTGNIQRVGNCIKECLDDIRRPK